MTDFGMPLWLALLDDEIPEGENLSSWCARAVDEIIAEEEDDDYTIDPYWKRGKWSKDDFEPF